jgi:hypothetical protein
MFGSPVRGNVVEHVHFQVEHFSDSSGQSPEFENKGNPRLGLKGLRPRNECGLIRDYDGRLSLA